MFDLIFDAMKSSALTNISAEPSVPRTEEALDLTEFVRDAWTAGADVKVDDKSLFLTVKPLNAAERATLLGRIREPYDRETAMNADAPAARRSDSGS